MEKGEKGNEVLWKSIAASKMLSMVAMQKSAIGEFGEFGGMEKREAIRRTPSEMRGLVDRGQLRGMAVNLETQLNVTFSIISMASPNLPRVGGDCIARYGDRSVHMYCIETSLYGSWS